MWRRENLCGKAQSSREVFPRVLSETGLTVTSVRKTYRYHFKVGEKVVHTGITTDPERREREHQVRWPTGRIERVGEPTSHSAAWQWEREQNGRA